MNHESDRRWGECWISHSLVQQIDQAMMGNEPLRLADLASKIKDTLGEMSVPGIYLTRLAINFVPRTPKWKPPRRFSQQLKEVDKIILQQFGTEMARRLELTEKPIPSKKPRKITADIYPEVRLSEP